MSGPLDGVSVLDLSHGATGAMTTMLLADNGASVIKMEPPGGDPLATSPVFKVYNRGKKSIILDLKKKSGVELLKRLASKADILLETNRPGVAKRLGFDYATLHPAFPRLVYCSLTGYGQEGAQRDRPGYDALVQARMGMGWDWVQGLYSKPHQRADGPLYLGFAFPSASAAYAASYGILAALTVREKSGKGQYVDASLLSGTLIMSRWAWAKGLPEPSDTPPPGGNRLWFQTKEGSYFWIHRRPRLHRASAGRLESGGVPQRRRQRQCQRQSCGGEDPPGNHRRLQDHDLG